MRSIPRESLLAPYNGAIKETCVRAHQLAMIRGQANTSRAGSSTTASAPDCDSINFLAMSRAISIFSWIVRPYATQTLLVQATTSLVNLKFRALDQDAAAQPICPCLLEFDMCIFYHLAP
jgi:hypothetical protein